MRGELCREHALEVELQLQETPLGAMLGEIDRRIARSRDPLVSAVGQFVSGLFSGRQQQLSPEQQEQLIAAAEARMRAWHQRRAQQQQARQPGPGPRPSSPPPPPPQVDPRIEARRVLGFQPQEPLSKDAIQRRKQQLARIFHPDMQGGSEAQMKLINQAADVLLATLP